MEANNNKIKVGWYAFAGGKFSPDPNAYPNCQGVVACLNPDPNAPVGKQGLILTPQQLHLEWASEVGEVFINDLEDGATNTKKLVAYALKNGISFPAADYCHSYSQNGVKPGKGFLPAIRQLQQMVANREIVNEALKAIGGDILRGWLGSSSEYSRNGLWAVWANNGNLFGGCKITNIYVRCVIAF